MTKALSQTSYRILKTSPQGKQSRYDYLSHRWKNGGAHSLHEVSMISEMSSGGPRSHLRNHSSSPCHPSLVSPWHLQYSRTRHWTYPPAFWIPWQPEGHQHHLKISTGTKQPLWSAVDTDQYIMSKSHTAEYSMTFLCRLRCCISQLGRL